MSKSSKVMLSVIGAVLAVCVLITVVVSVSKKNENSGNSNSFADNTNILVTDRNTQAAVNNLAADIIGKWTDSANMSGYEFFADGSVVVTYVNLTVPVVNFPINGSAKGSYTLSGNDLTVNFSIYSKTITKSFTASVLNNSLTLINKENSETSTYKREGTQAVEESTENSVSVPQKGIVGAWENGDGSIKYIFDENSKFTVIYKNANDPAVSGEKLQGTFNGVYMLNNEKVTVQFNYKSKKITREFVYLISGSTMSFTDSKDDTTILVRGTMTQTGADSLLGKWSDSTGMSSFDFKQGGVVNITYVNFVVPVINMPIDGTVVGSYVVKDNTVTISSSIYSKTIKNTYIFTVDGNSLILTDVNDNTVSTYIKK